MILEYSKASGTRFPNVTCPCQGCAARGQDDGLHYMFRNDGYADNAVTAVLLPKDIEDYGIRKDLFEQCGVILGHASMMSWEVHWSLFLDNCIFFCYSDRYKCNEELRFSIWLMRKFLKRALD